MLQHAFPTRTPPQRVVVIGAAGFVGGAVHKRLRAEGVDVLALGRADVDLLAADATERLAGLLKPGDAVVAAAARAPCKNLDMLIENMTVTRAMLGAITTVAVAHVVNVSSDAVYGDEPVPLTEQAPTAPGSLHGAMHLAREIAFRELKVPLAIVRPTLIYGEADPHNGYGPNRFRRLAAADQPITLFGEGEERRDHVHVGDVAEVIARIVLHRSTGTLNIASGVVHSFRAIADWAAGKNAVSVVTTPRVGEMPHKGYRPFDIAALRSAFPDLQLTALPQWMAQAHASN